MLKHLRLAHFRSYDQLSLEFNERVMVILGPNATGKTNILEAMYMAATGQSFRADDSAIVQAGRDGYRIDAEYDEEKISITYRQSPPKQKKLLRNEVTISRQTLLGLHPVVLFEPGDLNLAVGPPSLRRRYIDLVLAQTSLSYRRAMILYRRLLRQRNALLWRNKRTSLLRLDDQLFILDTQLSAPTETIFRERQDFLAWLLPILQQRVTYIADTKIEIELEYLERSSNYLERLQAARERDVILGTTTAGPHREDWRILQSKKVLQTIASRGESRTILLGLKLAEIDYMRRDPDAPTPLLLMDDVFSELDESRRRLLIDVLEDVQTIITTTDIDRRLDLPAQTLDLTRREV